MISAGWAVLVPGEDVAVRKLKTHFKAIHQQGTNVSFSRGFGTTFIGGQGTLDDEVRSAIANLVREVGRPAFHLFGGFGTVDYLNAEAFDARGEHLWFHEAPRAPRNEAALHGAYWRVHKALKWKGKKPLLHLFAPEAFEPLADDWSPVEVWPGKEPQKRDQLDAPAPEALRLDEHVLFIRKPSVPIKSLKSALESVHESESDISFYRSTGFTAAGISAAFDGPPISIEESAKALARGLSCEVGALSFARHPERMVRSSVYSKTGKQLWASESPVRRGAECVQIEKRLKHRLMAEDEFERIDSKVVSARANGYSLFWLPYWKLHFALGLSGKASHVNWSHYGNGIDTERWKQLEVWAPPLNEAQRLSLSQQHDEANARAVAAAPLIERALEKLATRVPPADAYALRVNLDTWALEAASRAGLQKLLTALAKDSLLLRKSKLAQRTALRQHPLVWQSVKVGSDGALAKVGIEDPRDLIDLLTPEVVRPYLDGVPIGEEALQDSWDHDESDQVANAFNALLDLKPEEVVQVLRESDQPRLKQLFDGEHVGQLKELIRGDLARYAPFLAEALARQSSPVLVDMTWIFLEPAAKKLSKNRRYIDALRTLQKKTQLKRYDDALKHLARPGR